MMENARELLRGNFSFHGEALIRHLRQLGYSVYSGIHMLSEFGLPQVRERALILAARNGTQLRTLAELWHGYRPSAESTTVRHAISRLSKVAAGETHNGDRMHVSPRMLGKTRDRLMATPPNGGSWSDLIHHPNSADLLIPSMKRSVESGKLGSYPDVYGRMWWDRPSVTIKRECAHVGNGRYSHPEQNRMCTVRELAILNGFPDDYEFESSSLSNKYRHIGDAVPPLISHQLAHVARWMISGEKPALEDCLLPKTSLARDNIENELQPDLPLVSS